MLLAALARPKNIVGLVGLACAPDFTEELIFNCFSDAQKETLIKDRLILYSNEFCEDEYPISYELIHEARQHLLLNSPINLTMPVRLIHG
ncbi:hypothetical protein ACSLVN_27455, partial [Klebsiella pneumoniae]